MGILLALAPFILFALIARLAGPTESLVAAAALSLALPARNWFAGRGGPKIMEIGSTLLFGGLALFGLLWRPNWSVIGARLWIDAGLLLIVLFSMMVGRPFTLQYAREQVAPEFWGSPEFVHTNYVITAVWAMAFAVMVLAELAVLYISGLPVIVGMIVIGAALVGAATFTGWYPKRVKAKKALAQGEHPKREVGDASPVPPSPQR